MHIVQSPAWTAAVGSQQASLESTGLCAGLAAQVADAAHRQGELRGARAGTGQF